MIAAEIIQTDPSEAVSVAVSLFGTIIVVYTLIRALQLWKYALDHDEYQPLRPMALRRFATQSWYLLMIGLILVTTATSLFIPLGALQASMRNNLFTVLVALLIYRAMIDHWQHRATDPKSSAEKDEIQSPKS
jgi:hypothetical protein